MSQARWPGSPEQGPFRVEQVGEGDRYELSEAHAIVLTPEQRAQLEAMGLGELEVLRQALKQTKRWPSSAG